MSEEYPKDKMDRQRERFLQKARQQKHERRESAFLQILAVKTCGKIFLVLIVLCLLVILLAEYIK